MPVFVNFKFSEFWSSMYQLKNIPTLVFDLCTHIMNHGKLNVTLTIKVKDQDHSTNYLTNYWSLEVDFCTSYNQS